MECVSHSSLNLQRKTDESNGRFGEERTRDGVCCNCEYVDCVAQKILSSQGECQCDQSNTDIEGMKSLEECWWYTLQGKYTGGFGDPMLTQMSMESLIDSTAYKYIGYPYSSSEKFCRTEMGGTSSVVSIEEGEHLQGTVLTERGALERTLKGKLAVLLDSGACSYTIITKFFNSNAAESNTLCEQTVRSWFRWNEGLRTQLLKEYENENKQEIISAYQAFLNMPLAHDTPHQRKSSINREIGRINSTLCTATVRKKRRHSQAFPTKCC